MSKYFTLDLIMETKIPGDNVSVEMFRGLDDIGNVLTHVGYAVRYGLQVDSNLTLYEAIDQFNKHIIHALVMNGVDAEEATA